MRPTSEPYARKIRKELNTCIQEVFTRDTTCVPTSRMRYRLKKAPAKEKWKAPWSTEAPGNVDIGFYWYVFYVVRGPS